jgi:serine protease Do
MRYKKLAPGVSTALAMGVVTLVLVPRAQGQVIVGEAGSAERPAAAFEVFAGRGSELGISIRDVEKADAERRGLSEPSGVVIEDVRPDSPAERAGMQAGDVMVEFDAERVRSARQLTRLVQETPAGRSVRATVIRHGRKTELSIAPEERTRRVLSGEEFGPAVERLERLGRNLAYTLPRVEVPSFEVDFRGRPGRLGVEVQSLTPQLADYFGAKRGVLVARVDEGTPAANAGLVAGDVITSVNESPVEDSRALQRALARIEPGQDVTLGIVRDRKETSVRATLPDRPERERPRRVPQRI